MRRINILFVVSILLLTTNLSTAQITTVTSGNWSTAANWSSNSVPASTSTINVNHAMTIDVNINANGNYTITKPVTDAPGGTAYTLDVNNILDMTAQGVSTFEGAMNVNGGATLIIETGDTLIVGGNSQFGNGCNVEIKAGGVLIVTGDLTNFTHSDNVKVNGTVIVLGDYLGKNDSQFYSTEGTGSVITTGSLKYQGSGQTFGNTTNCNTGPCGSSQFCATNNIAASQTICGGTSAAALTANSLSGYTYQWQKSTTSFYSGFADITTSGTSQNYSPGTLSATTYYRRKVSNGTTCTVYSLPVTITVNPATVSVTISSNTGTTICSGTTVTFTATPGVTETVAPSYQWKVNGSNVGSNSATYSSNSLANGAVVTCVMTSNTGCASPSTATSNALTMSVNGNNTWIGTTSSAWATASNWCGSSVPNASASVVIPAGTLNNPLVSTSVSIRNITVNASARLNIGTTGTLNIAGNFVNNGTYYDLGTTVFNGSSAQTISGVADSLNNLTIANTSGGVSISASTYVKKYLTLTSGTLTTNGNLTVDIYFGAILGSGSGSISGNVKVVRTIWSDKWHYISSPLTGRTVADWNTIVPIKFGVNANLYVYDETNTSTNQAIGWTAIGNTATAITSMKGYSLYFPRGIFKTTFTMTGTYTHSQTYSSTLSNTASGVAASDGWNLVGNPYPSEIDWDAATGWTKTGLNNAIYFYDQVNSRYASYSTGVGTNGGTRYIPCMQGFYVKVTNPGTGTLAMTNSVRSSAVNRDNWRVAAEQQIIRLTAASGNASDETVVRLLDNATDAFDTEVDAYKMKNEGNVPNISTTLLDIDYSINSIPSSTLEKTIPVKLIAKTASTYTITASISGVSGSVELEDRTLGIQQDLSSNPVYTVVLAAGDTTTRLFLHYKTNRSEIITDDNTADNSSTGLSITGYQQQVLVDFHQEQSNADVYVYDAIGNKVYALENTSSSSGKIQFTIPSVNNGVYLVKVVSSAGSKTQRVYLSK